MWHYLLLFVIALVLLACPSKPQRRSPAVIDNSSNTEPTSADSASNEPASAKSAGIYFALQSKADGSGYIPLVLHIIEGGISVATRKAYSRAGVFSLADNEFGKEVIDLSARDAQAINLLLTFTEGDDNYCVTTPLAEVVNWVRGVSVPEIKQKLTQTKAQPINLGGSKGTLEQQAGGWQCTGA